MSQCLLGAVSTMFVVGVAIAIAYWAGQIGTLVDPSGKDTVEDFGKQLTDPLTDLRTDISRVEALIVDVEAEVDVLKKRVEVIHSEKGSATDEQCQKDGNDKIKEMKLEYDTLFAMQQEMKKNLDNINDTVRAELSELEKQLHDTSTDFAKKSEENAQWFQKKVDAIEDEIKKIHSYLNRASESIEVERETKQALAEDVRNMDEMMELLRVNTFNKDVLLSVVVTQMFAICLLGILVHLLWKRPGCKHDTQIVMPSCPPAIEKDT